MQQILVNDAQSCLPTLIDEAISGEIVYIVGNGEHIVQLVPVAPAGQPRFGSAAGMISMSEDFDAPLDDFREYMQ
jgi:antitoxin (DNA-binding transcriptional repressor) of toxin-antitoxin stability system